MEKLFEVKTEQCTEQHSKVGKWMSETEERLPKPEGGWFRAAERVLKNSGIAYRPYRTSLMRSVFSVSKEFFAGVPINQIEKDMGEAFGCIEKQMGEDRILSACLVEDVDDYRMHIVFVPADRNGATGQRAARADLFQEEWKRLLKLRYPELRCHGERKMSPFHAAGPALRTRGIELDLVFDEICEKIRSLTPATVRTEKERILRKVIALYMNEYDFLCNMASVSEDRRMEEAKTDRRKEAG